MNVSFRLLPFCRLAAVGFHRGGLGIVVALLLLFPAIAQAVTLTAGDVLVADAGSSASTSGIIQVTSSGARAFVTGNGVGSGTGIDTPKYPICTPGGTIYYYETVGTNARKIISVNPSTGARTIVSSGVTGSVVGTGTAFITLGGLAWDASTSTIVAVEIGTSASNCGIVRIDPATGNRTWVTGGGAGSGVTLDFPANLIACSPSGTIYFLETANTSANHIIAVNGTTGARTAVSGTSAGSGTLWSSSGAVTGMTWDANGSRLVLSDAGTSASTSGLIRVNVSTGARAFYTGNSTGSGQAIDTPKFVVVDGAGTAYYLEQTTNTVVAVTSAGVRSNKSGGATGSGTAFVSVANSGMGIVPTPPPVINSTLAASGTYGTALSTYTITATNSPTSYAASGLPSGLSVNSSNGQITGTPSTPVGSPFNVTISATNAGGTGSATLVFTINKATLSVVGVAMTSKVYDGTTNGTSQIDYNAASVSGVVGSDSVGVDTSSNVATYADRNVGTGKSVTISGLTVNGTHASKYTLAAVTTTGNITAKALTVSGLSGTAKTYDGLTSATLGGTAALQSTESAGTGTTSDGKPYSVDSVSLSGTAAGTFATRTVGTAKAITVTGLSLTGTGNTNYTVTQPTGLTANITAKALSVSGLSAVSSRVYDGTTVAGLSGTAAFLTAETAGSGTTSDGKPYTVDTISISGTAAGAFATRHVGTAKTVTVTGLSVTGTDSGNYTVTQPTGLTADISAKSLTVSGLSAVATRVYDGTTDAGLSGTAAFLTAETAGSGTTSDGKPYTVDTISIGGTAAGAFATRHVGTAKGITVTGITVGGTDGGNYAVTQPAGLSGDVTAKELSVTGLTAVSTRIYDGTAVAGLSGTAAFQTAETAGTGTTSDGKPYTVDTLSIGGTAAGAFADRNVGTAKGVTVTGVTVTGTDSGNYTVTQPTGLTADVTAKALSVTGLSAVSTRIYDGTTAAGLSGTAALDTAETAGSGTTSDGKPYTVDTIALSGTAAGAFATRNVGTAKNVTVTGLSVTGTDSGNYSVTQPTGLTADITAKALTVSGLSAVATRVYDGTAVAGLSGTAAFQTAETAGTGTTSDGTPYTVDSVTVGGTAAGAFADRHVGTAKGITVTGLTATGTGSGNYTVTQPTGLTGDVTAKALNVSGLSAVSTRVYDGTAVAGLSGTAAFLTAETAGSGTTSDGTPYTVDTIAIGGTAAGAFATRHVGTAKSVTVTGLTVSGTDSGNYTVTQPTGFTADVTAKALSVSGLSAVATRVYDGTTVAGLTGTAAFLTAETAGSGTTSDGKPYTVDTVSIGGTAAGAFSTRTVGTAKNVTVTGITVTGTDSGNYSVTQPSGFTADITAKALTVAGVTASDKIYDATLTAPLGGTAAFLTAETAGSGTTSDGKPYTVDTIAIGGTAAGAFADKDVATGKAVTVTGVTVTGTNSGNYTVTQPAGLTAAVTAKALTFSGVTASNKVYDGTTAASLSGTPALQTAEAPGAGTTSDGKPYTGDTVGATGALAGTFATKDAATGKSITVTGVSLTGAQAGNYSVGALSATADITPKALTISGVAAVATRIYDGTAVAGLTGTPAFATAEATGVGTTSDGIPYTVDSVTVGGTAAGAFADRNVGTAKGITVTGLTVAGTGAANYTATQPTGLTADVTAKALSVSGVAAVATRIYDGTTVAGLTGTAAFLTAQTAGSGTTSDGKPYTVDTIAIGGTAAGAFATRHVGTAKTVTVTGVTVTGTDSGNYTVTQPAGLTADVTAKALSFTGLAGVATRTYDGTAVAGLTGTATFLTAETAGTGTTSDGKSYTVDTISVGGTAAGAFATRHVGTAKGITVTGLTVAGTDAANYSATQPTGLTGNITTKALTVTGVTASDKIYDATLTASLSGTAAFLTAETAGSGTTSDGKPYTVDTIAIGGTAAGVFADKDVATGKAVTVTGVTVTGTDSGNYTVTQPAGLTAAVTKKSLTVSGVTAANKVYDGTTAASLSGTPALASAEAPGAGTTSDGKPYTGDTLGASGTLTGTFASKDVGTAKTVTVTGAALTGAQAGNYSLSALTTTADVTPKALTISGVAAVATRIYDGTAVAGLTGTPAFATAEATGVGTTSDGIPYSVDSVTVGGTAAGAFATRNVGTAKGITVTGLTVAGTGAANYTATQPTGLTADVTAKALSVSGVAAVATRIYDGTTVAGLTGTAAFLTAQTAGSGTTSDGKPYTVDTIAIGGTAAGTFATRHVGTAKGVTVSGVTVTGTDSGNYTVTQPTGLTADVTAKALSFTGLAGVATRTYDGTTVAGLTGTAALLTAETAGTGTTSDGKSYTVDTISVGGTAAGAFATRHVGTAKGITVTGLTVAGTDAANYSATQPTGLTGNVTAKALTVTGVTASDKIYDATLTAALGGTAAFLTAETAGSGTTSDGKPYTVDTIAIGGSAAGAFADKDVATGKAVTVTGVTVTGTDSGNYTVTQPAGLTAAVTKKTLTVSGVTAANKVYDGTTAATLSGTPTLQAAEAPGAGTTADGKPYTGDTFSAGGTLTGTFADRHVGTGKTVTITGVTLSGAQAGNYDVGALTTTADITPKPLAISGVVAVSTRIYDGTTVAGLTGTAAFATAEATGVGTTSDGIPYTVDSVTVGGAAAGAFANRNVGVAKGITVTGLTVTGTGAANYTATQPTGLAADVTAKALSVAGLSAVATRIYDGTSVAGLSGTASFLAAQTAGSGSTSDGAPYTVDTIAIGGTAAGAFATRHVGTAKGITVTGVTVTGTDSGNYTVTQPTGLTADVTSKALAFTGLAGVASRTYDGTTVAGLTGVAAFLASETAGTGTTSDGKPYSVDTISVSGTAAGAFATRHVGTAKGITVTGLAISGTDAGNYTAVQPAGLTGTVATKALILTGVTASDKVYDATTTAALGGTAAFLAAETAGTGTTADGKPYSLDTIAIGGSAAGTFADKDVATGKVITITGLTITGADAGNYAAIQPTGLTAAVTKKMLTVSGMTASNKVYDGTTAAALSGSPSFLPAEAPGAGTSADGKFYTGDSFSAGGTVAGAFADRHAGTGKIVTVSGVVLTGAQAGNYSLSALTATADITPKALTISGVAAVATRTYDGTTVVGLTGTPAFATAEATGVGTTSDGIPYSVDSVTVGGTAAGAFATRHVGTAKGVTVAGLTVTGTGAANYTATQPAGLTADVTAKALSVTGVAAVATRVYDTTTIAGLTGTAAFLAAEAAGTGTTIDGKPYTVDSIAVGGTAAGAFATKAVGTGKAITVSGLTVAGTDAANYSLTPPAGLIADVTSAALTVTGITANNKTYDGNTVAALNAGTAALAGVLSGDTVTLGGTAVGAFVGKGVGTGKIVQISALTLSGTDAANYALTQPSTTATISAKTIGVSGVTASNKLYDGTTAATGGYAGAALTGVVGGDNVALATAGATATFGTKTVGTAKTVSFAGLALSGTDSGNYVLTQPTATADITLRPVTVPGITANNKVYDGTTVATLNLGFTSLVGTVAGDAVSLVSAGAVGTFDTPNVGGGKPVAISGIGLAGADSANYVLAVVGTTASITPATAAIVLSNLNQTYDGSPKAATVSITPSVPTTITYAGGATPPTNAGTYPIVVTVTDPNYTGGASGDLVIAKAAATIAIANLAQTYDGAPKPVTVTVTPNVATTVTYAAAAAVPANAGTYPVVVTVTDANYTGDATASLVIAKATQTLNFTITGSDFKVGASLGLSASASSGLPVTFAVTSGAAAIAGTSVVITQPVAVTIRATQAGNENYLPVSLDRGFTGVPGTTEKIAQTINFLPLPNITLSAGGVTLVASASSGLPVTFKVLGGPVTQVGNRLNFTGGLGFVTVVASQAGNDTFAAAPDVTRAFVVFVPIPDIFFGDLNLDPGAAAGRSELLAFSGPSLDAKAGDIAAVVYSGTSTGTVLIVAPSLSLNVSLDFTISPTGTYSVPFTSAGRSLVLTGTLSGSTLTGRIAALSVSFATIVQSKVGSTANIAGIYSSDAVNSASGGTSSIVGPNGQILVVASTGTTTTGAAGTVSTNGSFNLAATNATISGSVDAPTTSVNGTVAVTGQAPVAFNSLSAAAARTDRLANLSSRVRIAPDRTIITGFVIGGPTDKRVLIRGIGPSLTAFGVGGVLANPKLQLFDSTGKVLLENDDWSGADTGAAFTQVGAFSLASGSKDAALLATLAPGAYTVQITGGTDSGVALTEIYDASADAGAEAQRLINISTRGAVEAGSDGLLIGGFVVTGNQPKKVLVRGVGPGLAQFGVTGTLPDPRLAIYKGSTLVAQNDDWTTGQPVDAQQAVATAAEITAAGREVGAFALGAGSKDAAIVITLAPGAYTAQVSGANGGTAIVEIYELP